LRGSLLLALLSVAGVLHAQTYAPPVKFGQRLEPQGVLVHGAGQDSTGFANHSSAMPMGRQP
jgi:hypothetical protein